MVCFFRRASLACAALILCTGAHAQRVSDVEHDEALTLATAIELALQRNPELAASRYELSAAQARIVQAGTRRNPDLALEIENFAGSGDFAGTQVLETTLSLGQVIELGRKRSLRRSVAEADLDVVTITQRGRELDVLAEVTRRFIDVVAAQDRVRYEQQTVQLMQQSLGAITRRVEAARSPVAEQSRARTALTRAALDADQAASELRSARYQLAATWGDPEPKFRTAKAELFTLPATQSFQVFFERIERSPEIQIFTSESRMRDAELRLAEAQKRPNLAFSVGARRFEQTGDTAFVAGVSMDLPIFDRNEGGIAEARARLKQTEAQRTATQVRQRASLFALFQQTATSRSRIETLRGQAIPQAETALEQTQDGFNRGRFSFLELVSLQQELLELQGAAIDAAADYHRFLAEIERLTSEPLTIPLVENAP